MSPFKSVDLTDVVRAKDGHFVVLHSPDEAEHQPCYEEVARFSTRLEAERFVENLES
jgi:glycerophosphoryl diester phosphodiesterase